MKSQTPGATKAQSPAPDVFGPRRVERRTVSPYPSGRYEFSVTGLCLRKEERINSPAAIQIQLSATLNEGQA
jgi:hypothetical protein